MSTSRPSLAEQGRRLSAWLTGKQPDESHPSNHSSARNSRAHFDDDEGESHRKHNDGKPRLAGGNKAIIAFVLSLIAFTIQTEAAQYVQQSLGYRKPFFSLFIGHSSFVCLFPLYLGFLRLAEPNVPLSHQLHLMSLNLHWQLSTPTHHLPRPTPDSIRRRLSSLSMRQGASQGALEAEDFDIEHLQSRHTRGSPPLRTWSEKQFGFHLGRLLGVFAVLTFGITVPALSWYSAVPLTTMADITTIYNTYAIWALVFSIWFLGEEWERRKVFSVLLACGGVVLVAYGGAEHRRRPREPIHTPPDQDTPQIVEGAVSLVSRAVRWALRRDEQPPSGPSSSSAFLGDMLAFFGAVTMAAYEMAFKVVATLPDEDAQAERYGPDFARDRDYEQTGEDEAEGLLNHEQGTPREDGEQHGHDDNQSDTETKDAPDSERTAIWKPLDSDLAGSSASPSYQSMTPPVYDATEEEHADKSPSVRQASEEVARQRSAPPPSQDWIPPPLPFGMHPIIMTSGIGLVTLLVLWIGLPIVNALGWEPFELPSNFRTVFYLFIVAFTGIIFNGCFSILLALWGPVLASVSCLLTTVLVFGADLLLGHDFRWISLLGCVSIVAGFAVLVSGGKV